MLRSSLYIHVSIANWQDSTKNQTSLSRVKQGDLIEISSKVFSCVYMEEEHPVPVGYSTLPCPGPAETWEEPAGTVNLPQVSVAKMPSPMLLVSAQFVKSGLKAPNKSDIWNTKKAPTFLDTKLLNPMMNTLHKCDTFCGMNRHANGI